MSESIPLHMIVDNLDSQFLAGILDSLAPLAAILNPVPVSYLRMVPSRWAEAFANQPPDGRYARKYLVRRDPGRSPWRASPNPAPVPPPNSSNNPDGCSDHVFV